MVYSSEDVSTMITYIETLKAENARLKTNAAEKARVDAAVTTSRHSQLKLAVADEALNKQQAFAYADEVHAAYSYHGLEVPPLQVGEHEHNYRRRLLSGLQKYSEYFADQDLYTHANKVVEAMGKHIIEDALSPASYKVDTPPGVIRQIKQVDPNGVTQHKFIASDDRTFIHEIASRWPRRLVKSDFANPPCLKFQ
jgi:hypothetical protein